MAGIKTYDEIYDMIIHMPSDKEALVAKLVNAVPYEEKVEIVKNYTGTGDLNDAEKFVKHFSHLPLLKSWITAWNAKVKFDSNVEYIKTKFNHIIFACKEMQKNKNFHQMLGLILTYFNLLNASSKGNSFGFKIDETLSTVKKQFSHPQDQWNQNFRWIFKFIKTDHENH
jgi:hypothetical protein